MTSNLQGVALVISAYLTGFLQAEPPAEAGCRRADQIVALLRRIEAHRQRT
jgi:hypothetical protein